MVSSFLKNENYECILDFEINIPPVLSHPNNIHQLLTNVFSLLKSPDSSSGGILIQTKHQKDSVSVKFLSTDKICADKNKKENLSLKIVEKLMKNNEGTVKTSSDEDFGSTVVLNFPLKRNVA
jgi:two-component sensor histidine kinase